MKRKERMMNCSPLPFFVYGSLLPGQMNDYVWGETVISQQVAVLANGRLHDLGDYPILLETGEGPVKGMLITVRDEDYTALLARLDEFEHCFPGQPEASDYVRVAREVMVEGVDAASATDATSATAVTAWVYVGQLPSESHCPLVPNGDWAAYVQAREQAPSEKPVFWQK